MLGDTMGDLFQQIPVALILNVCVSGVLFLAALTYFAVIKPRRRKAREKAAEATETIAAEKSTGPPPARTVPAAAADAAASAADYEMPDLDMLVDDSGFKEDADLSEPEPAPVEKPSAPQPAPAPATSPTPRPKSPAANNGRIRLDTGETVAAEEVVSVRRDPRDGRLVVLMDGVGYRSLVDVPEVKDRFVDVMKRLNRVVTQPDTPPPAAESSTDEVAVDMLLDVPEIEVATPEPPVVEQPQREIDPEKILRSPPPPPKDGAIPGALPTYNMDEAVKPIKGGRFGLGPAKFEYAEVPELDIAGSIEAYLQHRIAYTPEFQGRDIHVHAAPGGIGVRIQVENAFYDAVDEIADEEARDFVAAVIAEWQARQ